ncbi:hypothetical protein GCM10023346_05050 [Arthrobacter gyeryongensis]|uniref:Uncharacterized protein n=1 Tax=Arthrobacter gyeryongensis TaxID=1650592 RepID=A0ABP9S2I0_9MICC
MGYDDAKAVGVPTFDKRDLAGCVGVCVTARVLQCLFEIFQALGALRGPHQQVVSQPARVALNTFPAFDDIKLEAFRGQEKGSVIRAEGYYTSKQVAVKGYGPVKFGYEQNG